jgi:hypothetical protein
VRIDGTIVEQASTTDGAFLDFAATNIWKSEQAIQIAKLFQDNKIQDGDRFLFTDFWNPVIIQTKYMIDLFKIKAKIHAIAHAGSYDPQDFLGRLIEDKNWSLNFEKSLFFSCDQVYFATQFHINMFIQNVLDSVLVSSDTRLVKSGQPHNQLIENLKPYAELEKKNLILFPHRLAPEKQPEIFEDLRDSLPEYEFVICQEKKLSKHEYHTLLGQSKIVFSANLQETLGISSCIEAPIVHSIPLVPNRLSYAEIFKNYPEFLYPGEWTSDWGSYIANKEKMICLIHNNILNYDSLKLKIIEYNESTLNKYASGSTMIDKILEVDNV